VQILPGARSVYWWQGAIEESSEVLLMFKTTAERIEALKAAILAAHSYQTPEVLVLQVESESADYAAWLRGVLG
jgi:periplasmic divalent cation tolerance protein